MSSTKPHSSRLFTALVALMGGLMALIVGGFITAGEPSVVDSIDEEQALAVEAQSSTFLGDIQATASERSADAVRATLLVLGVASVASGTGALTIQWWHLTQTNLADPS